MNGRALVLIVILLSPFAIFGPLNQDHLRTETNQTPSISERNNVISATDPIIYINSDEGFQTLGVPGDGTESNPYILEDYSIRSSSICISIIGTNSFFIIRNCIFNGIGTGVRFTLLSNGRVENCTFAGEGTGIRIGYSEYCSIKSCSFSEVASGIILERSNNCTIIGVDIAMGFFGVCGISIANASDVVLNDTYLSTADGGYARTGLCLDYSYNVIVHTIEIIGVTDGIVIYSSQKISIAHATITDSWNGVRVRDSEDAFLVDCVISTEYAPVTISESQSIGFLNSTITSYSPSWLWMWYSELCYFINCQIANSTLMIEGNILSNWVHSFVNVIADGFPLGYFRAKSNQFVDLSKYSQIIIVDCDYLNVAPLEAARNQTSISIAFSSHCNIQRASVQEIPNGGIRIISCENVTIEDTTSYSYWGIISIEESQNIRLLNISSIETVLNMVHSSRCLIENSFFSAVNIASSSDCIFRNTLIESSYFALSIYGSINCSFIDTQLGSLVEIFGDIIPHWNHYFENVTIDGFLFGYFYQFNNGIINGQEYGHIYLYGCEDTRIQGTEEHIIYAFWLEHCNNIIIEYLNIAEGYSEALVVIECLNVSIRDSNFHQGQGISIVLSDNVQVTNCSGNDARFFFHSSSDLSIIDNDFNDSLVVLHNLHSSVISRNSFTLTTIEVLDLDTVSIINNNISSESDGIRGSILTRCEIIENEIECNGIGISIDFGEDLMIGYNSINGAHEGINMTGTRSSLIYSNRIYDATSTGIILSNSETCTIRGNLVARTTGNTQGHGIYMEYCVGILVTVNMLLGNQGYGINVQSVSESIFWGNFFRGNGEGDAREIVTTNEWSSSEGVGNYWADQDNSSIAIIEGGNPNYDENPLTIVEASSFPIISSNSDLSLAYDNDSVTLSWIIWTLDHCIIIIEKDGIVDFVRNATESFECTYAIANLTGGYHNFTIAIYYKGALHTVDTVMIFMEISNTPLVTMLAAIGLVGTVVILEFLRKRKTMTGQPAETAPVM